LTKPVSYEIRGAREEDIPTIIDLLKKLAVYEKLEFKGTEELYRRYGFSDEAIWNALLVENASGEGPGYLGIALYFFTFSTFEGRPNLYLEDIFVLEEYRGHGIETRLLVALARKAVEKDCGRMEWSVLDWNEPSIQFYLSLGARPMDEWTVYRLTVPEIKALAEKKT